MLLDAEALVEPSAHPPAAHRQSVGLVLPHPDVGTSESHPETHTSLQDKKQPQTKPRSLTAGCVSPQVQEASLGFLVKDDGWTLGISWTGVTCHTRHQHWHGHMMMTAQRTREKRL